MSQQIFGAAYAVIALNRAFNDESPANAVFQNQVAVAQADAANGFANFAKAFSASFAGLSNADLAAKVMGNLGLLPNDALQAALVDYLNGPGASNRGLVVLQLATILTGLENAGGNQSVYNAAAAAWNSEVTNAFTYSADPASTVPSGNEATAGKTFALTAGADNIVGTSGNDTITALTINSTGAVAQTFSAFDNIDGGAGTDTLNVYTTATENEAFPTAGTVKNVEIVNIYNSAAAAALADASKFEGVTQLWQHATAADVTNLAATTTAGFKAVEATVGADLEVTAATAATTVAIALDGVKGAAFTGIRETLNRADIDVAGAALTGVTVTGTLAQKITTAGAAAATLALNVTLAKDAQAGTVNSAVATVLTIDNDHGSTKDLTSVDASASAGAITYTTADNKVATIKTGAGNDTITTITATLKDDASTAADETISALVESGAGNDAVTINTTGTGTTTVNAGDGNDTVTLTGHSTGKLTVNLGAGDDTFKGAGAVAATDAIDAGAGTDTLLLNMVGAANIGAFSNFETFDAAALAKTLDVEILAAKNTVTEFVASADVGAAAVLTNLGAGVNFRATGNMTTNALKLTQKTAGALTVTLDADSTSTTAQNDTNLKAVASNATSLKAVFAADSGYNDPATNTNDQTITLTGTKATALEVVSGGTNATNTLAYTSGVSATTAKDLLASITISGDKDLSVTVTESAASTSQVTSINASALTGKLTISTAELKAESATNTFDGGVLTLGSGADFITITQGAVISGLAKGTVEDATLQGTFDVLSTGAATQQAADVAATATLTIKDGKFTFNGTGPATLADAISAVDTQLTTAGDAVVFEYVGNSYVFVNNDAGSDIVVKLAGVTGLAGLDEVGTSNNLYVF